MPLDASAVARKLAEARKLQGLTVDVVSAGTGISQGRMIDIEEHGERPSGDEVLILAYFYKHDFRDFVDDSRPRPFESTEILYRRHGSEFLPSDRRSVQEFLYLCEIEAQLERELKVPKKVFEFHPQGNMYIDHGVKAASSLRAHLGYSDREVPRDVFADFRDIGVHVFRRRLSNRGISGLYVEHPVAGHCVLINYDEDIYRQRFSVSHEVAHAIFDSSDSVVVSYRRGSSGYDAKDLKEFRANRFASCFLMPPQALPRGVVWGPESALYWAQEFRVSTTALSIALSEEKLIDADAAQQIRSVRLRSADKIDPEAPSSLTELQKQRRLTLLERGLSDYYVNMCFDAHQYELMSAGALAEALLSGYSEMKEIALLYGRAVRYGT